MRALCVDFGNVIAFFDHQKASRQLAALSARPLSPDDVFHAVFESPIEPDVDRGRIPTPDFLDRLRRELDLAAPDEAIVSAWCDIFEPNAHLIAQLPALRQEAGRLVLASNTNDLHFQWIARQFAEPLSLFDGFVLSHQVGVRKPERAFFERCVRAAGAPASECVFVDDKAAFVEAARAAGMSGIVYTAGLDLVEAVGHLPPGGPA